MTLMLSFTVLVLYSCTIAIVAAGKLLPATGSFSFFSPQMRRLDFSGVEAYLGSDYGTLRHTGRSETAVLEDLDEEEQIAVALVLENLFSSSSSDSLYEKHRRVLNKYGKTLVSVSGWSLFFCGWYNYAFEVTVNPMIADGDGALRRPQRKKKKNLSTKGRQGKADSSSPSDAMEAAAEAGQQLICRIEFLSARPARSWLGGGTSSKRLRIRFDVMVDTDGNIQLMHHYATTSIATAQAQLVVGTLQHYLLCRLRQDLSILKARKKQLESYDVELQVANKKKRDKRLDKILHPEKYRATSPTVRRSGSAGSQASGRYTPSADTRARRQVRRS